MFPFRTIKDIKNLKGARVLLRLDVNEPVELGVIKNDYRVRRSLPTIKYLKQKGARIIIIAHADGKETLRPIVRHMNKFTQVGFSPAVTGKKTKAAIGRLKEGGAIMLENLRSFSGEEKNSKNFSEELASLGEIYVNDAFAVSHRSHASIVGLPEILPHYAGLLFVEEFGHLSKMFHPRKPFLLILGGAKIETKLPLVKRYLPHAENIFIAGGPVNNLFKLKGYEIGRSIIDKNIPGLNPLTKNKKIVLPTDVRLQSGETVHPNELSKNDKIVDIGPHSIRVLKELIADSKTVLFNGPVGIYDEGHSWGTEELLKLLAKSDAEIVVGGGDTLALVTKLKFEDKFTFASTAGGAMLEFLAKRT